MRPGQSHCVPAEMTGFSFHSSQGSALWGLGQRPADLKHIHWGQSKRDYAFLGDVFPGYVNSWLKACGSKERQCMFPTDTDVPLL